MRKRKKLKMGAIFNEMYSIAAGDQYPVLTCTLCHFLILIIQEKTRNNEKYIRILMDYA